MRAFISVFDKSGLEEFLKEAGNSITEIYATGKTYTFLKEHGFNPRSASEITGFDTLLGGRVKTLHPGVFAGILSTRDEESENQLKEAGFLNFDVVITNLYPFREAAESGDLDEMIENIDIGGISLIRAAAKNYRHVAVISDPSDYHYVAEDIRKTGGISVETRQELALRTFSRAAQYDIAIYNSLYGKLNNSAPEDLFIQGFGRKTLRYGENPDQEAYLYSDGSKNGIANAQQLYGTELSYNNLRDANSALETVLEFDEPAAVAIKHNTPCGVSSSSNLQDALQKAVDADKESRYGSVIAVNRKMDSGTASVLKKLFIEVVIAPDYDEDAMEILKSKKKGPRILKVPMVEDSSLKVVSISNGFLVQSPLRSAFEELELKTSVSASTSKKEDLEFAWKVVAHCRSNAIVLVKDKTTTGIGAGQTSRVEALRIAAERAGSSSEGSVLASDAFFPFDDNVDLAGEKGISAIIQPGGSIRDNEVIEKSEKLGIPMYFTGKRVFLH